MNAQPEYKDDLSLILINTREAHDRISSCVNLAMGAARREARKLEQQFEYSPYTEQEIMLAAAETFLTIMRRRDGAFPLGSKLELKG